MEDGTVPPTQLGQRVPQNSINKGRPRRSDKLTRPWEFIGGVRNWYSTISPTETGPSLAAEAEPATGAALGSAQSMARLAAARLAWIRCRMEVFPGPLARNSTERR